MQDDAEVYSIHWHLFTMLTVRKHEWSTFTVAGVERRWRQRVRSAAQAQGWLACARRHHRCPSPTLEPFVATVANV